MLSDAPEALLARVASGSPAGAKQLETLRQWAADTRRDGYAVSHGEREEGISAVAVPVTVKMPDPITIPTPRNARLHGPSVFRSRLSGSSEDAIRSSILLVRKRVDIKAGRLTLALAVRLPPRSGFIESN